MTPDVWDRRLVDIKLSSRWQAARLKSIVGTYTKIESVHLLDDRAHGMHQHSVSASIARRQVPLSPHDGAPAHHEYASTQGSPASETRDAEEPEFCSDGNEVEEDTSDLEAAKVNSLGTDVDAALRSLSLSDSEEQVSQNLIICKHPRVLVFYTWSLTDR